VVAMPPCADRWLPQGVGCQRNSYQLRRQEHRPSLHIGGADKQWAIVICRSLSTCALTGGEVATQSSGDATRWSDW